MAGRAVVLDGADSAAIDRLLRPSSPGAAPVELAARDELAAARDSLHRAGFLWLPRPVLGHPAGAPDRAAGAPAHDGGPLPERLLADVGAMAARRGDEAGSLVAARRAKTVRILGGDRTAPALAALLAAAGVGCIEAPMDGRVRLHQTMPGGLAPGDEGRGWREAVAATVRRAAPESPGLPAARGSAPDLVVLATSRPIDDDTRDRLHRDATPHLVLGVDAVRGIVGPLVVPGLTSCLRCLDLHRGDRDPAWWALSAQLATAPARAEVSDVALCAIIAGVAAAQVLALLDGEWPATCDGTLELVLPDWRLRRRSRPPHRDCACRTDLA
jgi:hypothetical protein